MTADGNRVYFHEHKFNTCLNCGEEEGAAPTGSVLSGGSLVIIVGVACLAVGFLAAMFIFKKKKPVTAGENNE